MRGGFDIIICNDVLHYVATPELRAGMQPRSPSRLRGVAYLGLFTSADDIEGDSHGFLKRPPSFYRRAFEHAGLRSVGMHCWIPERARAATARRWSSAALDAHAACGEQMRRLRSGGKEIVRTRRVPLHEIASPALRPELRDAHLNAVASRIHDRMHDRTRRRSSPMRTSPSTRAASTERSESSSAIDDRAADRSRARARWRSTIGIDTRVAAGVASAPSSANTNSVGGGEQQRRVEAADDQRRRQCRQRA